MHTPPLKDIPLCLTSNLIVGEKDIKCEILRSVLREMQFEQDTFQSKNSKRITIMNKETLTVVKYLRVVLLSRRKCRTVCGNHLHAFHHLPFSILMRQLCILFLLQKIVSAFQKYLAMCRKGNSIRLHLSHLSGLRIFLRCQEYD